MNLEEELAKCETMEDLTGKNGLIQKLVGGMVEKLLEKEMKDHLGYEKHSPLKFFSFFKKFFIISFPVRYDIKPTHK